jgi:hypothetical protein
MIYIIINTRYINEVGGGPLPRDDLGQINPLAPLWAGLHIACPHIGRDAE